jgi:hypothetical protein
VAWRQTLVPCTNLLIGSRFTADSHARRSKYRGSSRWHCIIEVEKTFLSQRIVDAKRLPVERSHEPWKTDGHREGAVDGTRASGVI